MSDVHNAQGERVSIAIENGRHGGRVLVQRSIASDMRGGRRRGDVIAALPVEHADAAILEALFAEDGRQAAAALLADIA